MKFYIFIVLFLSIHLISQGQTYRFNNLEGEHEENYRFISRIDDDNVFIMSSYYFDADSNSQVFTRFFDTKKMELSWLKKSFQGADFVWLTQLKKNKAGNFIITGEIDDFSYTGKDNPFLCEINKTGELLWILEYNSDEFDRPSDVIEIDDGYVVSGKKYRVDSIEWGNYNVSDAYVRKFDFKGDSLWTVYFIDGKYHSYEGKGVVSGAYNVVYFVYTKRLNHGESLALVKMDGGTGEIYWEKEIDESESGYTIIHTKKLDNGNILIQGDLFDAVCRPLVIWEVDEDGKVVYKKDSFPEIKCWSGTDFSPTNDNGFVAVSYNSPKLIKFDKNYNVQWIESYEFDEKMYPTDVVQMENGDYILIGSFGKKNKTNGSGWLIKTNENGKITSVIYPSDSNVDVKITPNPTQSFFEISTNGIDVKELTMKLFDTTSKEIFSSKFENRIDLSKLISGVYYLHIFSNEKLIRIEKIVKI